MEQVKSSIMDIRASTTIFKDYTDLEHFKAICEWICPTDYSQQWQDILSRHQEGTGLWFLNHPLVSSWIDSPGGTLYCPGHPGTGKTILAALVADHLSRSAQNLHAATVYLFCNYGSQDQQTEEHMLSSILRQVTWKFGQPHPSVLRLYSLHEPRKTRPSLKDIQSAICEVATELPRTYVILDALDELSASMRVDLLASIRAIQTASDLNVLATSRFIPDIQAAFARDPSLGIRATAADIDLFIRAQKLPSPAQKNPELCVELVRAVSAAVDGMFLLARLYMDDLTSKRTVKAVKATLAGLPQGANNAAYEKAYSTAMERIYVQDESDRSIAVNVLAWVVCARRPLTPLELQHALAVEPEASQLDKENIVEMADLLSLCAGLVTYDELSNRIRLAHYTTHEYLKANLDRWIPSAQATLTSACVDYLLLDTVVDYVHNRNKIMMGEVADVLTAQSMMITAWGYKVEALEPAKVDTASSENTVTSPPENTTELPGKVRLQRESETVTPATEANDSPEHSPSPSRRAWLRSPPPENSRSWDTSHDWSLLCSSMPLLRYAATHWGDHARLAYDHKDDKSLARSNPRLLEFLLRRHATTVAALAHSLWRSGVGYSPYNVTGAHLAAAFGCVELMSILIDLEPGMIDEPDHLGRTPLAIAASHGQAAVVSLLLQHDTVDVNSESFDGETPLFLAAESSHVAVVDVLLRTDRIRPNHPDDGQTMSLIVAARNGNVDVVRIMLQSGKVDINAKGWGGETAMGWAAQHGHKAIVSLLVDHGVNLHEPDGSGRTPLMQAVQHHHADIAWLIINASTSDFDATDQWNRTALQLAYQYDESDIYRALRDSGKVRIDFKSQNILTILEESLRTADHEAIRAALARGDLSDPDPKTIVTSLEMIASRGFEAIAQDFLAAHDLDYKTLFRLAAYHNNESLCECLLRLDVELDVTHALKVAAAQDHVSICTLILDSDKREEVTSVHCASTFYTAAFTGQDRVCRLFMERGVSVDNVDEHGITGLIAAASAGANSTCLMLLQHHANIEAANSHGMTALLCAASSGHASVCAQLLDRGASAKACNKRGMTALMCACLGVKSAYCVADILNLGHPVASEGELAIRSNLNLIKLLVEEGGSDMAHVNHVGSTVLHLAVQFVRAGVVKYLLTRGGCDANAKDPDGDTALALAIWRGNLKIVKLLCEIGTVRMADVDGMSATALHVAVFANRPKIVQYLISLTGCEVNARDSRGRTALMYLQSSGPGTRGIARGKQRSECAKILLVDGRADATLVDVMGRTALHWAAWAGDESSVKYLLADSSRDINIKDARGDTALMLAMRSRSRDSAIALAHRPGVDLRVRDRRSSTGFSVLDPAILDTVETWSMFKLRSRMITFGSGRPNVYRGLYVESKGD